MPRLPDANSLSSVRTNSVMPVASYNGGQIERAVKTLGNAAQGVGEQAMKVAIDERNAHDNLEEARARSYILQKSVETVNGFDGDTDYGTYEERYNKAMNEAANDAAKLIRDPTRQAIFRENLNADITRGQQTIRTKSRSMAADVGLTNMQQGIIANNSSALATQDPVMKQRLFEENAALIDNLHNEFPETFKASDAFKAKQEAAVNGYALPQFSTRNPNAQLELLAEKLGYTLGSDEEVSKNLPMTIRTSVDKHAARRGLDPKLIEQVIHIENPKLDPNAVSPTGVTGFGQITKATAKDYNLKAHNDVEDNIRVMADVLADRSDALSKTLGRPASGGEAYLAYQQGLGGARALLTNPDKNAIDALTPAYKGDRAAARQAVLKNGGTAEMTASQFAEKWTERVTTTATPGAQGVPTGTELDVVPYETAAKMYEPAAQNAFFSRVESDPAGAIAMLDSPAFARIDEKTKTAWRAAGRAAFTNLEENAKTDRIMSMSQSNQEVWNSFIDGKLVPSQITQLESTGKVTPELANYIRTAQAKAIPVRTVTERNDRNVQLFEQYAELGISKNRQTGRTRATGDLEQFVKFQRDVVQAASQGYITREDANNFLKNLSDPMRRLVENPDKSGWFSDDPNLGGYEVITSWLQANGEATNKQVKAELLRRFVLKKEEAEASGNPVDVSAIAKDVTQGYMKNKYPILQLVSDTPNGIIPKDGPMQTIVPGPVAAKPQASVTAPFETLYSAKTGSYWRKYADGTIVPAPTK